jgi:hypothetical protein
MSGMALLALHWGDRLRWWTLSVALLCTGVPFLPPVVQEFCDQGSLLTAIARGIFLPTGRFGSKVAIRALYRTAREVAQGMVHLHSAQVVHGGEGQGCRHRDWAARQGCNLRR